MSIDEILSGAEALVENGNTPAIQVALARDNEIVAFETFGAATNNTKFMVFSATKPIVASAVWILIGEGLLDITRPVAHYIPEFATNGKERITVEQVLLHTAGFPNAPMDPVEGADTVTRVKHFTEWELEWEPGTRFEYHALAAHWVLAELLERLTGDDFRDVIEQRICEPLGLPLLLGIPEEMQSNIADGVRIGDEPTGAAVRTSGAKDGGAEGAIVDVDTMKFNEPAVRAAGVPGGGGLMTAATMALFYQGVLHNPDGLWDNDVWRDATTNIRCVLPDPLMNVACNRSIGLVLAGDDGLHQFRYGMFGKNNSPRAIGHAGAHCQVAWADPENGVSFAMFKNGLQMDMLGDAVTIMPVTDLASSL